MRLVHIVRLAGLVLAGSAPLACGTVARNGGTADRPLDGNSFVVQNVRVFDGERAIERADVVVRGGRIAAVGRGTPPACPSWTAPDRSK
jgi:urease alpha subunit